MAAQLASVDHGRDTLIVRATEASDGNPAAAGGNSWLLGGLFRAYWGRMLIAYGLVTSENLLMLAQPWALGLAINDLLKSSSLGLVLLVIVYLGHLLFSSTRRAYDARAFTRIYADLATRLVFDQRHRNVDVSRVVARSALSREFVQFFQIYLPLVLQAIYSLVGAIAMLCFYDWVLAIICFGLAVPACVLNFFYSRKVVQLNTRLHDELEREVKVISDGIRAGVNGHYHRVSFWRIKLADSEALNFGLIELFVITLLAITLVHSCGLPGVGAGDIVAVFRYVIMFVTVLDTLPVLIQHISRLRDIGRRIHCDTAEPLQIDSSLMLTQPGESSR